MMAAITASSLGGLVTVYEKEERVGQKILKTGNGKCNLSNLKMDSGEFYSNHPKRVKEILHKFSVKDTIDFFGQLGVMIRDKGGYLYPYSEQAQVVLDALRFKLDELGVGLRCEQEIKTVNRDDNGGFRIGGETFDKVIIACGSMAAGRFDEGKSGYQIAKDLGHKVVDIVPGLCKLVCWEDFLKALAGVRCQAKITLMIEGKEAQVEVGELQFVATALSGIPIFQMSRTAAYALKSGKDVTVLMNLFPDKTEAEYEDFCRLRLSSFLNKTVLDFLLGMTNKKINQVMIKLHDLKQQEKVSDIGEEKMLKLLRNYRNLEFKVKYADTFANAQVAAGGVSLADLSDDLESLIVPGLYFIGEIVDVDGRCGGYNLQWAWSSGYIAGVSCAK